MSEKIIIANWKANPPSLAEAKQVFSAEVESAQKFTKVQTVICPPFVFIEELAQISRDYLGAQDLFWEKSGPYTGEISIDMLKNLSVKYVLIGHSDRRYVLGETDEIINKKIKATLENEITPVLLVGEREKADIREDFLVDQLSRDLEGLSAEQIDKILIAYEPVWAISTHQGAQVCTPEDAVSAIKFIFEFLFKAYGLKLKTCLYGGSVNAENITDFLKNPEIGGAVVGAASLKAESFTKILELTSKI